MPFPTSNRVLYQKNPLAQVICQFRFPAILRIGVEEPAAFQESIRTRYPLYGLQEPSLQFPSLAQVPKELATILGQLSLPMLQGSTTHRFSTKDSQRFITLSPTFLALSEDAYTRWETFREELVEAERAFRETYQPAFYTRIGLRYQDLICRSALGLGALQWRELLAPHIAGMLGAQDVADSIDELGTQSVLRLTEVPDGKVRIVHGLAKSPDAGELLYSIDADFWIEKAEGLDEPFAVLDRFNRLAGNLFRWAITDKLHRAMEPHEIQSA